MKSKLGISLTTDCLRREWGDSGWREFSEKLEALCVVFGVVLQGVVHPSKFIKLFTSTAHTLLYITMPQWYWLKSDVLLSDELGGNMWKKKISALCAKNKDHYVLERAALSPLFVVCWLLSNTINWNKSLGTEKLRDWNVLLFWFYPGLIKWYFSSLPEWSDK